MAIDVTKTFDQQTLRRISNLEERVKDVLTAQKHFVSLTQTQELLTTISTELQTIKETLISLEKRVSILEDIPEIN